MEDDSEEPMPTRGVIRLPFRRLMRVFTARRSGSPVGSGLQARWEPPMGGRGAVPAPVRWRIDAGLLQGGTASGADEPFHSRDKHPAAKFAAGKGEGAEKVAGV